MESSTIVIVVISVIVIWALFFRKISPSSKTDSQLWMLYKIARPGSEQFDLIEKEMEKRGLINAGANLGSPINLSHNDQQKLDEANKLFEESGMQAEMQKMLSSEIPEKIFNKTLEIAKIKGVTEVEASTYFNELFEAASEKYKNMGLSQLDIDERALNKVLGAKIE